MRKDQSDNLEEERLEPPVDLAYLYQYSEDPEDIKRFSNIFIQQSEESLKILSSQCSTEESQAWVEAAHKLKGGAGIIGAMQLQQLCEQAQSMETANENDRKEILDKIQAQYEETKEFLESRMGSEGK